MIEKLLEKLRPKIGTVTNVDLINGFIDIDNQYLKYYNVFVRTGRLILDSRGIPIKEAYTLGIYRITVTDSEGKEHQVEHYGKPPVIGSQMRIRSRR